LLAHLAQLQVLGFGHVQASWWSEVKYRARFRELFGPFIRVPVGLDGRKRKRDIRPKQCKLKAIQCQHPGRRMRGALGAPVSAALFRGAQLVPQTAWAPLSEPLDPGTRATLHPSGAFQVHHESEVVVADE
jgi:hypothetical protein